MEWTSRTRLLLGDQKQEKLQSAHVLVAGLGGVGSYAAEMLVRAGVGKLTLVDGDTIHASNRNRQLPALISTEGRYKAEVLAERFRDINPEISLCVFNEFLKEEKLQEVALRPYDYIVDAIDSIQPKIDLIRYAVSAGTPIISSMGAGGKMDPSRVTINDISKTSYCKLAATIRRGLRNYGIFRGVTVVYSTEPSDKSSLLLVHEANKKSTLGTISFLPAVFGCFCSYFVIRDLTNS